MPSLFYAGQPDYIEKLNTLATAASMTNGTVAASFLSLAVTGTATAASFVGPLTGNASTATTLATARNINGVAFNGSADITVTAAAGTLTGTTLAANVVNASLNSITPTGGTLDVNGIVEAESYKIGGEFVVRAQPVAGNYFLGRSGNLTNTGSGNTGVGDLALSALTTGVDHTAVGSGALQNITGAVGNTAVGRLALNVATTATNNTALGDSCLRQTTTGNLNVAVGYTTMDANTTGQYNTAVGAGPLRANTTGESNVAIGCWAMFLNTTSSLNTAVGDLALYFCNAGEGTAVGALSLYQATARRNTAIGTYAGFAITSGESNTFIGYDCGNTSQTATVSRSIAIGNGAFTTADDQCVIGGSNITETKLRNVSVTGSISATSYIEGAEQTAPAAPAANGYRIFAQDNGAGKTQLMVIFASGAAQQIAIEP